MIVGTLKSRAVDNPVGLTTHRTRCQAIAHREMPLVQPLLADPQSINSKAGQVRFQGLALFSTQHDPILPGAALLAALYQYPHIQGETPIYSGSGASEQAITPTDARGRKSKILRENSRWPLFEPLDPVLRQRVAGHAKRLGHTVHVRTARHPVSTLPAAHRLCSHTGYPRHRHSPDPSATSQHSQGTLTTPQEPHSVL